MKLLNLVIVLALVVSCDSAPRNYAETGPIQIINDSNMNQFMEACDKLAECVGATAKYKHLSNQAPASKWACALTRDDGVQYFFYPRLEEHFGVVDFSGFNNEIEMCHFAKRTGEHSLEHQKKMRKLWKDFEEANKENERKQKEEERKRREEQEKRKDRIEY